MGRIKQKKTTKPARGKHERSETTGSNIENERGEDHVGVSVCRCTPLPTPPSSSSYSLLWFLKHFSFILLPSLPPPPDSPRPYLSEYLITALSCFFVLFSFFLSLASFSLFSPSVFVFIYHPLSLFFPLASFFSKPVLYLSTNFRRPEEVVHLFHPTLLSLYNLFEFPVSEKWEMFSPLNIGAAP